MKKKSWDWPADWLAALAARTGFSYWVRLQYNQRLLPVHRIIQVEVKQMNDYARFGGWGVAYLCALKLQMSVMVGYE